MKTFRPYQPDQVLLLPPSLRDWLPQDHLAHFVREIVEQLDLSDIYRAYREERGYPPYDPLMMVKILVYAYARGIRSSRKIAAALHEDVAFRVLSGNQQPSFSTIALFRRRHHEALGVYGNLGLRVWPRKFERCGQEERATPAIRENSSLKQPNFKEESPRSAECGPD